MELHQLRWGAVGGTSFGGEDLRVQFVQSKVEVLITHSNDDE